ncbi:hypothetical protein [Rhodococcus sp. SGAir0479]|uniref:hypothetical protein n=1 Tax=Rhodococcus sp. SGAir0479 TaxID=2567884 RepID=UPI0010CD5840|nr:hypothetical protein [Rhodococcus sp. SGAir0479]QCQ92613.1 hypothetical protein E7742_16235 [Rhodococcus sp. SGAir0479]
MGNAVVSGCELLRSIAADTGGTAARALGALTAPIRIQIVGRAGVGRTTVARLLAAAGLGDVTESGAVDAPGSADPELDGDVVVHVLSGPARTPDLETLRRAPREVTVALVNKADLQPSWATALVVAAECEAETDVVTLPIVGADDVGPEPDGRADALAAVAAAVEVARARRSCAALAAIAQGAARGPEREVLEQYLRSDEAVRLAVRAADAAGTGAGGRRRRTLAARRAQVRAW